jgi:hypothetical protein
MSLQIPQDKPERSITPTTVTITLQFLTHDKRQRRHFPDDEAFAAWQRELAIGRANEQQTHTFEMPPAAAWTTADLDEVLAEALRLIDAVEATHEHLPDATFPCAKGEAYYVEFQAGPGRSRRHAVPESSITVSTSGPYLARVKFEEEFPLWALVGWLQGLRFRLELHWYQPTRHQQIQFGAVHAAGERARWLAEGDVR